MGYMAMALTSSQLSSSLCYAACHHSIQIINFNENLPIMSFVHINNIFLPYVRSSLSAVMGSTPHSALSARTEAIALFHVPHTKTYRYSNNLVALLQNEFGFGAEKCDLHQVQNPN